MVLNHDTGKVIWAHEGHGKTIFTKFFKLLTKFTARVRGWSKMYSGMYQQFLSSGAQRCIDTFQGVQRVTDALDEIRRLT